MNAITVILLILVFIHTIYSFIHINAMKQINCVIAIGKIVWETEISKEHFSDHINIFLCLSHSPFVYKYKNVALKVISLLRQWFSQISWNHMLPKFIFTNCSFSISIFAYFSFVKCYKWHMTYDYYYLECSGKIFNDHLQPLHNHQILVTWSCRFKKSNIV